MKAYRATFKKKDGELRTMTYANLSELPEGYLPVPKGGKTINLQEGMQLVWDLEHQDYRILNKGTVVGAIVELEY